MKSFYYNLPTKIISGEESDKFFLNEITKHSFNQVLVLTGIRSSKNNGNLDRLASLLEQAKLNYTIESSCKECPDFQYIDYIASKLTDSYDCVIALGGGSVIDCAKGASLQSANYAFNRNLSSFSDIKKYVDSKCKVVAIPTTIGTGSESNGTFIINDVDKSQRIDFFHLSVRPIIAWLDPNHIQTLETISIENGLVDVISHLLEQYFSDEDELFWSDYQIIALLKYCIKCYNEIYKWNDSIKLRNEVQIISFISMSYLFSQGKRLNWSLHNKSELTKVSTISHASLIRKYLPIWLHEKSSGKIHSDRIKKIDFVFIFIENINQK